MSETNWAIYERSMKRGGRWESCVWLIVFDFGWINENWWNQFKCSAQKRKQTNQSNSARLLLLFSPFDWTKRKSNWEKRRREGRASQTTNKRKREAALKLFLLVGYGRWPSCSAPIPLIFSFPIQRLISCCSPHASLLPLFFGAQPKKKSWNEDKLRQLNNKWKRGMIWRKWKQRREWSWVDWIENI